MAQSHLEQFISGMRFRQQRDEVHAKFETKDSLDVITSGFASIKQIVLSLGKASTDSSGTLFRCLQSGACHYDIEHHLKKLSAALATIERPADINNSLMSVLLLAHIIDLRNAEFRRCLDMPEESGD